MKNPILDFKPIFYIIDRCKKEVLAAKKQDRYEVSGVYVKFDEGKNDWVIWSANFNNQLVWEFPTRFEITKNEYECWFWALDMSAYKNLTDDRCLQRYPRAEYFPKY